jgi:hypothetical protein
MFVFDESAGTSGFGVVEGVAMGDMPFVVSTLEESFGIGVPDDIPVGAFVSVVLAVVEAAVSGIAMPGVIAGALVDAVISLPVVSAALLQPRRASGSPRETTRRNGLS